jgi:transposase
MISYSFIMSEEKQPRPRRSYTSEFKQQLVDLYRSGKCKCGIVREYDIASLLLDEWIAQAEHSGSFKEKDNRTLEQQELINLRKQNQQLKMENDILKQAALILGRK